MFGCIGKFIQGIREIDFWRLDSYPGVEGNDVVQSADSVDEPVFLKWIGWRLGLLDKDDEV